MIEALYVAVPSHIESRAHINPTDLTYFEKLSGIKKTRRWVDNANGVILNAINKFDLKNRVGHLDSVIVVTQTPSRTSPCMAMSVVSALGLPQEVMAFDINQSCTGYIYGLHIAKALTGRSLLVCIDQLTLDTSWIDELIFSDAVSFTLLNGYSGASAHLRCGYKCFPEGIEHLQRGIGDEPIMHMDGGKVFDWATKEVPEFIMLATSAFDAQALVLHQANESMMDMIVKRSKFKGLVPKSINEYGNASMNSIPITIAMHEKELLGKRLLLCGYGAGFSLAGAALGWPDKPVSQLIEI